MSDFHACHARHGATTVVDQQIFCAGCQTITLHKLSAESVEHVAGINRKARGGNSDHVDRPAELIATCDVCGRALKFPMCKDQAELQGHFDRHASANKGQVSVEMTSEQQQVHDANFKKLMGIA